MSCIWCEQAQEDYVRDIAHGLMPPQFFMRVGNGNVQVIACDKHLSDVQRIIRVAVAGDDARDVLGGGDS